MKERIIRNWITTALGVALMGLGLLMWYQGKMDVWSFIVIVPIAFALIWVKHSFFKMMSSKITFKK